MKKKAKKISYKKYAEGGYGFVEEQYTDKDTAAFKERQKGSRAASGAIGATLMAIPNPYTIAAGAVITGGNMVEEGMKDEYGNYKSKDAGNLNRFWNPATHLNDLFSGEDTERSVIRTATGGASELVDLGARKIFGKGVFGESDAEKRIAKDKQTREDIQRRKGLAELDFMGQSNYKKALANRSTPEFMKNGGTINLSNKAVEFKGSSHENGGIKNPIINGTKLIGAEVEGGETAIKQPDGNVFIFSEDLGFADRHKPIARQIGKTEKLLESNDNRFSRNTLDRLKQKENNLKLEQEQTKQRLNIPSDFNKFKGGGFAKIASYAGDIAGIGAGLAGNLSNRGLISERQKLLDNLPDQRTADYIKSNLVENKYNPAIRQNLLYQQSLNQSFSDPQVAAANKSVSQSNLIDSINRTQSDANMANTDIKNKDVILNNQIQTNNNQIIRNNNLTRLGGQDDIIRDQSTANAELINTLGDGIKNISARSLSQKQRQFEFGQQDPRIQKQIARMSPEAINDLYSQDQIDQFGEKLSHKEIAQRIKLKYNDQGDDKFKNGGLFKKYQTGGTAKINQDEAIKPGQFNSSTKGYLLASTKPEDKVRLEQANQMFLDQLRNTDLSQYDEVTHQKWGTDQGYINKDTRKVTQKGILAGYNMLPSSSKIRTPEYTESYNKAFQKGDSIIRKQIETGTFVNPDAPVFNWKVKGVKTR